MEVPEVPAELQHEQAGGAQSVDRALSVLACFRNGSPDLGVSQIAGMLELKTSTAHRLVRTLLRAGFLEQDAATSRYRLGSALAEYGQIVYRQRRLHVVSPYLWELSHATGEHAALAMRHGSDVLLLTGVDASVSESAPITGSRIPLHASAMGKVLLAWADPYEADPTRIGPLTPVTARTITDADELRRELERTRRAGYALSDEEMDPGIRTVAVPIFDAAGHAAFTLAVRGRVERISRHRIRGIVEQSCEIAEKIRVALIEPA